MPVPVFFTMTRPFDRITLLGGGLLGGSLALALDRQPSPPAVRLWARSQETVRTALQRGITGATADLAAAVAGAELAVLAVPIAAMPGLLRAALDAGLPDGCLVTDVGSVKRAPHESLAPILAGRAIHFVGSHPMAGSEKSGISAADAGLFRDTACLLTKEAGAPDPLTGRLEQFWQHLGCRTSWWTAAAHDELMAHISHLPHVLAAHAALACIADPDSAVRYCGNGLRDTTRVASGDPAMWADILIANRDTLVLPVRESIAKLTEFAGILEANDPEALRVWLAAAKSRRDSLG